MNDLFPLRLSQTFWDLDFLLLLFVVIGSQVQIQDLVDVSREPTVDVVNFKRVLLLCMMMIPSTATTLLAEAIRALTAIITVAEDRGPDRSARRSICCFVSWGTGWLVVRRPGSS